MRKNGTMRLHIAADHAGYDLKQHLVQHLTTAGHEVTDHGAHEIDPQDDYPAFCISAGEAVVAGTGTLASAVDASMRPSLITWKLLPYLLDRS